MQPACKICLIAALHSLDYCYSLNDPSEAHPLFAGFAAAEATQDLTSPAKLFCGFGMAGPPVGDGKSSQLCS